MVTKAELGSYAILLGGGLAVIGIVAFAPRDPLRTFFIVNRPCDPQGVLDWLNLKRGQGKITQEDITRLLFTDVTFEDWLRPLLGPNQITTIDFFELSSACPGVTF